MTKRTNRLFLGLFFLLLGGGRIPGAGDLHAQGNSAQLPSPAPGRVPATILLVHTTDHGDAAWVILRRPESEPHDVILLRAETADAMRLTAAVVALQAARIRDGDVPTRPLVARRGPVTEQVRPLPWAQAALEYLKRGEIREIRGVGKYPALEVWLRGHSK